MATENALGGIKSSPVSGNVNVSNEGIPSVNDVVTAPGTGNLQFPESFGNGPWTVEFTQDDSVPPENGIPTGGNIGDIIQKKEATDYSVEWVDPYNVSLKAPVVQNVNPGVYNNLKYTDIIVPSWNGKSTLSKTPEPTAPATVTGVPFYLGVVNNGTTKSTSLEMTGFGIPGHEDDRDYMDWYDGTTGEFVWQIRNYQISGNEDWKLRGMLDEDIVIYFIHKLDDNLHELPDAYFDTHFPKNHVLMDDLWISLYIPTSILSSATVDGAKAWLQAQSSAGTPVTFYYVTDNPIKTHKKTNITGCTGYTECWGATKTDIFDGRILMVGDCLPYELTRVNPNLLDNWYLGNPINQRGESDYTVQGSKYCIDRWIEQGSGTLSLTNNGYIKLQHQSVSGINYFDIYQKTNFSTYETVTFSVFVSSGTGIIFGSEVGITTDINGYGVYSVTINGFSNTSTFFYIRTYDTLNIIAAKLEYGTKQTLCNKVGNSWVLNETPDEVLELTKCQRYLQVINAPASGDRLLGVFIAHNSTDAFITINTPTTMRSNANATYSKISVYGTFTTGLTHKSVILNNWGIISNGMEYIVKESTGTFIPGQTYRLSVLASTSFIMSCEL